MNDKPLGGRRIFHWCGHDRASDTNAMTAAVAETIPGLCCRGEQIARLNEDGSLDSINLPGLQELINQHLCSLRIVRNGTGYERQFFTFQFALTPNPGPRTAAMGLPTATRSDGPDAQVLREVYDQLPARLPRVVE
jgi:hypothetical protein